MRGRDQDRKKKRRIYIFENKKGVKEDDGLYEKQPSLCQGRAVFIRGEVCIETHEKNKQKKKK